MHSSYARASGEAFLASSIPPCMIVEDEPGTRTIISRALASHGLFACEFADIDAAISALQEAQPKIIFLNASLSGANTMAAIRGLADCCYAGAVQLISKHKPDTLDTVCKLGERHGLRMRSPIVKPFSADAIRVVVQDEGLANPVLAEQPVSLEEALRRGWVELWYQPKIDLQKRTMVGAEGLARVRHPQYGTVPPRTFLGSASQGDLAELSALAITIALRDWSLFAKTGTNLKLAVNVTASVLAKLPLAEIIREHRPKREDWPGLILEVTEDEVLQDVELIQDVAAELSLCNVSLSIDDFGSAYSSMERLSHLPCTELKLDGSFVSRCADNDSNLNLCASVINSAHELGLAVTGEAIERTSDLHALRKMGCDLGQGFLFSTPVERDQLVAAIAERQKNESAS